MISQPIDTCITGYKDIPVCLPDDTIGHALSHAQSSHQAIFVFDKFDNFWGVVCPWHSFFLRNFKYNTKCQRCLIYPPFLTADALITTVASYMVNSKLYQLPVFDNNHHVIGSIRAKDILATLLADANLCKKTLERLSPNTPPITLPDTAYAHQAYDILKQKNISRLILINQHGELSAIVSRKDIFTGLSNTTDPGRYRQRQRGDFRYASFFDIEPQKSGDFPVMQIAQKQVNTLPYTASVCDALTQIVKHDIQSIIFINKNRVPTGIISRYDYLHALAQLSTQTQIPITIEYGQGLKHHKQISDIRDTVEWHAQKINQHLPLSHVQIKLSYRNQLYQTQLKFIPKQKTTIKGTGQAKSIKASLNRAIKVLDQKISPW